MVLPLPTQALIKKKKPPLGMTLAGVLLAV